MGHHRRGRLGTVLDRFSELAPPGTAGSALTIQAAAGFTLTAVKIWGVSLLERGDGTGWRIAFAMLALGSLVGIVTMKRLRGRPDAREWQAGGAGAEGQRRITAFVPQARERIFRA